MSRFCVRKRAGSAGSRKAFGPGSKETEDRKRSDSTDI
jgi:hypothetical protein